jgi:hypothetical protein
MRKYSKAGKASISCSQNLQSGHLGYVWFTADADPANIFGSPAKFSFCLDHGQKIG